MRKLLTAFTALTLVGGVSLGAPARTLALVGSGVYWISTAPVGEGMDDGTSCASPTHQYDATAEGEDQYFNDLLDDILTDVAEQEYASATIAICDADGGAQQVYEMDADTPLINVEGVEITIAGVLWDATSEADVAGAGDVVIDGMNTFDEEGAAVGGYSPFEFNNADVYIGYLTIRDAFDDVAGAAIHFEQGDSEFIYELNLDHVVIDGAWINDGGGAGVYAEGSVTITDSTFTDNRANGGDGGAIYASAGVELAALTTLTISNSQFYDSSASGSGGAIYTPAELFESLTIESNKFQRNTAGSQGGAIRVSRGTSGTSITRNTFTENSAEQGGAVSINDGEDDSYLWSITRNTFTKNRATLNGGALHMALDNSGNVVAPNVKRNGFKRNSAPAAGAVVVESDYGTGRAILRRYERGLRGNSFQGNRATSERRSPNIGVHFDVVR